MKDAPRRCGRLDGCKKVPDAGDVLRERRQVKVEELANGRTVGRSEEKDEADGQDGEKRWNEVWQEGDVMRMWDVE